MVDHVAMKLISCLALLISTVGSVGAQDSTPRTVEEMHKLHHDAGAMVKMLEDPARDAYQKPHEVITALKLKPGEVIADIGAGSGYFTFRLANHVRPDGRVYAVDINPDLILRLNRQIRELNATNVVTVLCPPDDPLLPDHSVDRFFICDTWHHIEGHANYLNLLKKMLKPGGEIVMLDFKKEPTPMGPPLEMRISRNDLVREMEENGFRVSGENKFLEYQYFLIFKVR
jgi:arsenite methyltransferase